MGVWLLYLVSFVGLHAFVFDFSVWVLCFDMNLALCWCAWWVFGVDCVWVVAVFLLVCLISL